MKKRLLLSALTIGIFSLSAQSESAFSIGEVLKGKVMFEKQAQVSRSMNNFAVIEIFEDGEQIQKAQTDLDGSFVLDEILCEDCVVKISSEGYKDFISYVNTNEPLEVKLVSKND